MSALFAVSLAFFLRTHTDLIVIINLYTKHLTMRKTLLLLFAVLLMPVIAMAQTNMALQKTQQAYANQSGKRSETRLHVPYEVIGRTLPASGDECYTVGWWFNLSAYCSSSTQNAAHKKAVLARLCTPEHMNLNGSWLICVDTAGTISLVGHGGAGEGGAAEAGIQGDVEGASIALDQWYYMTFVVDNANSKAALYLDGELLNEWTLSVPLAYGGTKGWADGEFYFADYGFSGMLDDVQFYSKALSAEEVAMAKLNPSIVGGLTALYNMEEATAVQANSAPDGTINAIYQNYTAGFWGSDGLGGYTLPSYASEWSEVETVPTLAAGREDAIAKVTVMVEQPDGGVLSVMNGGAAVEDEAEIPVGTELTITATPADGYSLVGIYAVDLTTMDVTEISEGAYTVTGAVMFRALFSDARHALTVVNEHNLAYTITRGGEAVTDLSSLIGGADYRLTVEVPSGMVLNAVRLGDEVLTAENGVYTIILDSDATLTIDAREKVSYTVTFVQPEGGTVGATYQLMSATGASTVHVADGASLVEGTELTLTNTPADRYSFVIYTVNGTETGAALTLSSDVEISAVFNKVQEAAYFVPTGNGGAAANCYVERASTTGAAKDVVISRTQKNGTDWELCDDEVIEVNPGTTFSMNWYAKHTNTTPNVPIALKDYDFRYCQAFIYADWNADGKFDLVGTAGSHFGENGVISNISCNYATVMDITQQFDVPANAALGRTRIRIIYTGVWDDNTKNGASVPADYDAIYNGYSYDYCVNVVPAVVAEHTVTVASVDPALGTVSIVDPATTGSSLTTTRGTVKVSAAANEGATFMYWTANGEVVSTDATYIYVGENDIELTAHFGYVVTYTVGAEGSAVFTIDGAGVANGDVVAAGSQLTVTLTVPAGMAAEVTANGNAVPLAGNNCTVPVDGDTDIEVTFVSVQYTLALTVVGQGDVQIWTEGTAKKAPSGTQYLDGDEIHVESSLKLYIKPADGWKLESATFDKGNGSADEVTKMLDVTAAGYEGYQFKGLARTTGNVIIAVTFTEDSTSAIEGIGIDPENGPVEYFNLQGVQVSGENLAPGFYIVRQGDKTAKILVK